MARMCNEIIAGNYGYLSKEKNPPRDVIRSRHQGLKSFIKSSPHVFADNVAEYVHSQTREKDAQFAIPVVMPPFDEMWVEYRYGLADEPYQVGFACVLGTIDHSKCPANCAHPDTPLILKAEMYILIQGERDVSGPVAFYDLGVKATGEMAYLYYHHYSGENEKHEQVMNHHVFPLLLGLGFMNCKNVQMVAHEPPPAVQRARQRRGKPPVVTHYTLEIEPMKKVLRTEGRSEELGLKRALHICRGHFATYSEDKPLFGKHAGRFWIPAHVRGSKDAGEIKKDYSVKI